MLSAIAPRDVTMTPILLSSMLATPSSASASEGSTASSQILASVEPVGSPSTALWSEPVCPTPRLLDGKRHRHQAHEEERHRKDAGDRQRRSRGRAEAGHYNPPRCEDSTQGMRGVRSSRGDLKILVGGPLFEDHSRVEEADLVGNLAPANDISCVAITIVMAALGQLAPRG